VFHRNAVQGRKGRADRPPMRNLPGDPWPPSWLVFVSCKSSRGFKGKKMIGNILAAIDGSETSRKALTLAAQLARNTGANLIITTVVSDRPLTPDELEASPDAESTLHPTLVEPVFATVRGEAYSPILERPVAGPASDKARLAAADRLLTGAAFAARQAGASAVETLVESGDPADRILSTVKSRKADLLVVGSRGLSGQAGRLLGGVSEKVIVMAPCPVLIVKPSDYQE
jgi:nucleotide-binding universal stress UspA family protein